MKNFAVVIFCFLSLLFAHAETPAFSWVKQVDNTNGNIFIMSSVADASGNLYMTGTFTGTLDFDSGIAVDSITDAGFGDIFISKIDSVGNFQWAKRIGRTSYDQANSIALDAAGNIYVAGFFSMDSTDFDPGPGTSYLFNPMSGAQSFILKLDPAGSFSWAKVLGSASNSPNSIIVDASDNILLTGFFGGTVDFDPGPGSANLSASVNDIYILKLNGSGDFLWVKQVDAGVTSTRSYSIASDSSEDVYISGLLLGTVDFDPGPGVTNLTSSNMSGGEYILKLDSSGNFLWAKLIDGNLSQTGADRALLVDAAGNSYTSGWFGGSVDFDPGAVVYNLVNSVSSGASTYLLKLDAGGNFLWAEQIGDPGNGNYRAITLDASNNLFITGSLSTSGDFDPGLASVILSASNGSNFVAKYDSAGNYLWAVNFSNVAGTSSHSNTISIDPFGNVLSTGLFSNTGDFDPGTGVISLTSNSPEDVYFHRMNQHSPEINSIYVAGNLHSEWSVYPNPGKGTLTIQTENSGSFFFTNEAGQVLRTFSMNEGQHHTEMISGLSNGIYFLIGTNQGVVSGKKIVVQK